MIWDRFTCCKTLVKTFKKSFEFSFEFDSYTLIPRVPFPPDSPGGPGAPFDINNNSVTVSRGC